MVGELGSRLSCCDAQSRGNARWIDFQDRQGDRFDCSMFVGSTRSNGCSAAPKSAKGRSPVTEDNQESPRVSIVLPVYNGARYIEGALRSIRAQTMPHFELIIADNASTDDTLDICRRHADDDPRIRILTADRNNGAAWNFNRAVDVVTAPFFKWAAHDDLIDSPYLERCLAVIEVDPSIVLASPKAVDIDEQGDVIGPIHSRSYATQPSVVDRVRDVLSFDTACVEVFGVIRTGVLRTTSLIGPYTSSDRTLLLELALRGTFVEIDDVLMRRRQHGARSIRSNAQDRNAWFDPTRRPGRSWPRWRLTGEYYRSLARAPIRRSDRLIASVSVTRWALQRWGALAREAGGWMRFKLGALSPARVER